VPVHLSVNIYRAGLIGGTAGHLSGTPTYKKRYDVTGIIGRIVLVYTFFHMERISPVFKKILISHIPRRTFLKNIVFKERQIFSLLGAPIYLGPALRYSNARATASTVCS